MAVDLNKNKDEIMKAWKDVLDEKTATDWVLFDYEGQTNVLKLSSKGDGGLLELTDELNSGKIMYAIVSVQDPKTSLTKIILINWQGEGAPVVRKGTCANHLRDISKLLAGAHLTIAARTDDDVDADLLMEKLSAVGSAYSFKDNRTRTDEDHATRVGTNYSRVNPSKEINSKDRDNFWKKEEEEERNRIAVEQERRNIDRKRQEDDRRKREELEHKEREKRLNEIELNKPKENGKSIPIVKTIPKVFNPPSPVRSSAVADEMREQRNREAKELIGSRVDTAKAIFAQNTASAQMSNQKSAPIKPVRNSIAHRINSLNNQQQEQQQQHPVQEEPPPLLTPQEHQKLPENSNLEQTIESNIISSENIQEIDNAIDPITTTVIVDENDQFSTIKRSPYTKTSSNEIVSPVIDSQTEIHSDQPQQPSQQQKQLLQQNEQQSIKTGDAFIENENKNDEVSAEDIIYENVMTDAGLRARALYDYQADDESEITFDPGDIITHIDQIDEGWWQGLGPDGTYGLFPANYVELIN